MRKRPVGIAMCGRSLFSKGFFGAVIVAGCGHVSGLFARHRWPLALMKSACQIPIVSGARGDAGATCLVIGIGTGFNSALVLEEPEGRRVPPSESGHANMMVRSAADQAFFDFMVAEQGFAAIEDALSGRGLENIYRWLAQDGDGKPAMTAAEITRGADETAQAAMRHFVANLGNTVGNLALIQLPFGSIYMVGGVARAMTPYLKPFGFREHFIDKGRFGEFMERFSVHVIDDDWAALIGCAQHLASRS